MAFMVIRIFAKGRVGSPVLFVYAESTVAFYAVVRFYWAFNRHKAADATYMHKECRLSSL